MAEKISPTPWIVGVKIDEHGWPTYRLRDMRDPHDREERRANADLMQAAPRMYEALKALLSMGEGIPHGQRLMAHEEVKVELAMQMGREALAAADGDDST